MDKQISNLDNSEELVQASFHIDPKLDAITPKMSLEEFKNFKANIKSEGIKRPIRIRRETIDGQLVKTIVDGFHRYTALKELGTPDYEIPFVDVNITQPQEALEYSFKIDRYRKNINTYQLVTWALGVFGDNHTDKEIAFTHGLDAGNLSKIKKLNNILVNYNSPEIATKYTAELNSGSKGYTVALKELENADNISNIITVIDSKEKLYYKTAADKVNKSPMTPQQVKAFKAQMEEKYAPIKFTKDNKVTKKLYEDIDKLENPEFYEKAEKGYQNYVHPLVEKFYKAEEKFPNDLVIFNVTSEEGYDDCIAYLNSLKGTGKLMGLLGFFNLPKDMVQGN
jgi:hypothetical protein